MADRACEELGNPAKQMKKAKCHHYLKKDEQVEPINTLPLTKKLLSRRIIRARGHSTLFQPSGQSHPLI